MKQFLIIGIFGLLLIGLGLRLTYHKELKTKNLDSIYHSNSDAYNFLKAAEEISENVSNPYHLHYCGSKAYVYLLSFFEKPSLLRAFQGLCSALSIVLLFFALTNLKSFSTGIISGLLLVFYKTDIFFTGQIAYTSFTMFGIVLFIFFYSYYFKTFKKQFLFLSAGALIFTTLFSREYWVFFVIFTFLYFFKEDQPHREKTIAMVLILGIGGIVFSLAKPDFPLAHNLAIHTYIGNNENNPYGIYKKISNIRPNAKGHLIDGMMLSYHEGKDLNNPSLYFFNKTIGFVKKSPIAFLTLIRNKLLLLFNNYEISNTGSIYGYEKHSKILPFAFITFGWLFSFALLGAIVTFREYKKYSFLYILLGFQTGVNLLVFIADRYRFQLVPVMICFAALGLDYLIRLVLNEHWKRTFLAITLIVFSGLTTFSSFPVLSKEQDIDLFEKEMTKIETEKINREKVLSLFNKRENLSLKRLILLGQHLKFLNIPDKARLVYEKALKKTDDVKIKGFILANLANALEDMFLFDQALIIWKELENNTPDSELAKTRISILDLYLEKQKT